MNDQPQRMVNISTEELEQMLDRKLDQKFTKFQVEIEQKIDEKIDELATVMKNQFDRVDVRLEESTEATKKLSGEVFALDSNVHDIKNRVEKIEKDVEFVKDNMVYKIQHEDLASRVTVIEAKLAIA